MSANTVWRDYNTDGVPASGAFKPVKADIRTWGSGLETSISDIDDRLDDIDVRIDNIEGGALTDITSVSLIDVAVGPSIHVERPNLDGVATGPAASVGKGSFFSETVRTSGKGQYGDVLVFSTINFPTPIGEFDVGVTAWVNNYNLTGGAVFGMWAGANTPSAALGETYSSGYAVGMEINVGNRWSDFGLQTDVGGTRYTAGLQVVPDVTPAADGATVSIYPGTFGVVLSKSNSGHKWWTGNFIRTDAIMPGGYLNLDNGGSLVGLAALAHSKISGWFTDVFDLTGASIVGTAFKSFGFYVTGGGAIRSTTPTAGIGYATGAGGAVTQATSRTTGVTLNTVAGAITLVSAAGSATFASFTVTSSAVAATDTIIINQKSGTDLYEIHITAVAAGSFRVTYRTTGGTTTEQPVFNFAVIKAAAS